MSDDDKIVFHDRPDPPKPGVPPAGEDQTLVKPPDAAPVPAPVAGGSEKVDAFIDGEGRKITDDERAKLKVKMFSKAALRQFVLDLIAELSRKTCEDHVREIAELKAKIAALESGETIRQLKASLDADKAGMRNDFGTEQEGLRSGHEEKKRVLREEIESEFTRRLNELQQELIRLRTTNPEIEAKLAKAQSELEKLNVELAMYQELQRQLASGQGRSKLELEKIVAELRSRILELESELEHFQLDEEPEAAAFAQRAEALSEKLLAKADAASEVLGVAARQAALDARGAEAKFEALRAEMNIGNGSIANLVDMVKFLKDVRTAKDVAKLGE